MFSFSAISKEDAYIFSMDTEKIGICASIAGAGRESKDDEIDLSAGIRLYAKTGEYINAGDKLATIYTKKVEEKDKIENAYFEAVKFSHDAPKSQKLILDIIE
jgi:pyrimidine-nucleoside phosphorylase